MKYVTLFFLSMAVFMFAACAGSEGSEPTVEPGTTEAEPALATAVAPDVPESYPVETDKSPVFAPAESYPDDAEEPALNTNGSYPAADTAAADMPDTAYPAEADLAYADPAAGDGQSAEAPPSGASHDATAISHQVSQDLAKRVGVNISEVTVVSSESREWSDGSLGCPAPGFSYVQVLTSGYQITLEVDGSPYDYHTDLNGNFVLCGQDGQPVE
ncbi:MAG: hypothetical protein CSA11_00775 [Chloroflexi bacterium]|nr:MAG: hypothetical protein CSB13_07845 [Chloroflexota bacterium]PIE82402.1 MAG: hypothetical protein CSA11_00775 [Chloroflexota bacterium]